jgi:probable phosphoglycerate mutase
VPLSGDARVLYVARHGETDWNAEGRMQGHTDVPLNAMGRAQAMVLAARLRGEGIRTVGSSDLSRARVTAEIAARQLGLEVSLVDPRLRERSYGLFEGLTLDECRERYPEEWARAAGPCGTPPGGETLEVLTERMLLGARSAAEELAAPALLVSHGRAIRELVLAVTGSPVAPIPNAGIYRFVVARGDFLEARELGVAP